MSEGSGGSDYETIDDLRHALHATSGLSQDEAFFARYGKTMEEVATEMLKKTDDDKRQERDDTLYLAVFRYAMAEGMNKDQARDIALRYVKPFMAEVFQVTGTGDE
jgi:hypothetical protein